jgi:hypothetical protein
MKSYSDAIPDVKLLNTVIAKLEIIEQKVNIILAILISAMGFEILKELYELGPVVVTFFQGLAK